MAKYQSIQLQRVPVWLDSTSKMHNMQKTRELKKKDSEAFSPSLLQTLCEKAAAEK